MGRNVTGKNVTLGEMLHRGKCYRGKCYRGICYRGKCVRGKRYTSVLGNNILETLLQKCLLIRLFKLGVQDYEVLANFP